MEVTWKGDLQERDVPHKNKGHMKTRGPKHERGSPSELSAEAPDGWEAPAQVTHRGEQRSAENGPAHLPAPKVHELQNTACLRH